MALRDQLRDPWTYILAGMAGGVAWAVGIPVAAAVGVAGVVGAAKTVVGSALGVGGDRTREPDPAGGRLLPVTQGSPEGGWLDRSKAAVGSFDRLAGSLPGGPLGERTRMMGAQAHETVTDLARLAGQTSAVTEAAAHLDPRGLAAEGDRLREQLTVEDNPRIKVDLERSLTAVRDQAAISARLTEAREQLLARLESGTLGLERLVAQLAEVTALADPSTGIDGSGERIDELAGQLEGLRAGLAETEALSERALREFRSGDSVEALGSPAPTRPDTTDRREG
jgi:hypothetical protein